MGSIGVIKKLLAEVEESDNQLVYRKLYQELYLVPPVWGEPEIDPIIRLQRFDRRVAPFSQAEKELLKAKAKALKLKEFRVGAKIRALDKQNKYQEGVILMVDLLNRRARIRWDSKPNRSWRRFRDLELI